MDLSKMITLTRTEDEDDRDLNQLSATLGVTTLEATNDSSPPTLTPPAVEASQPLVVFTAFPRLALELRRKIWKVAAHLPRIIVLESGTGVRARRPPAILHTSSEARQEGLRYYALTDFDVNSTFLIPTPIYFNGFIDIVFFGKNTCLNTLGILLRSGLNNMTVSRQSVSRVAFDVDAPGQLCLCDLNCEGRWSGVQFGQSLFGYREIFDHEAQLKALHGVDSDYPQEAGFWPGCRQLKEIIFITKGYDLALSAEELSFIDDSVTLRPAGIRYESDLWNVDHKLKNVLVRVVKKVRDGNYSPSSTYLPPPSRWSTNPPSISFQHLYLHDEAQRVHQNLILSVSSKYLMNTVKDLAYSFEPGRLVRVSFYQKFREDGAAIFKVIGVRDEVGKVLGKIRRRLRLLESTLVLPRHAIREIQDEDSPFSFS